MRHDWIIDVLTDLAVYAQKNGLLRLAEGTEVLLLTARAEIAQAEGGEGGAQGGTPPGGLQH